MGKRDVRMNTRMYLQAELDALIEDKERLGTHGFNSTAEQRAELSASLDKVNAVAGWLQANVRQIKALHTANSSYGLKHIFEREIGFYIPQGVLIAAAILCGYPYQREGMQRAIFAMSSKDINRRHLEEKKLMRVRR